MWVENGGDYVTNTQFIFPIPAAPNASSIEHIWKVDPAVNGGYPYINLFPDLLRIDITPQKQAPYVCIFGMRTPKENFASNGIAILTPTVCDVGHVEINGMLCVNMEHPIDEEDRHELIKIGNILKVDGQLYTIKRAVPQYSGNSGKVVAYAEHIFYQLADGWIFPPETLYGGDGNTAITSILAATSYQRRDGSWIYGFDGHSDLTFDVDWTMYVDAGCTPIEALLGSKSLVETKGGELYRDNFYFSINERMEGARDNAFDIRIGKNLKGIKRTIDMTSMVSYFRGCEPETGAWFAVAWDFEAFFGDLFPHYVVRSQNFSLPMSIDDEEFDFNEWFHGDFREQVFAFFRKNGKPIIGYEIDLEDVRDNPDFEITADETLRVGDVGTIYDERLGGKLTIELTGTTYDAIRGKMKRLSIGNKQSFVSTSLPSISFDVKPQEYITPIFDCKGRKMLDARGRLIVKGGSLSNGD